MRGIETIKATNAAAARQSWTLDIGRLPPSQNDFKAGGMPPSSASTKQLWAFIRGRAGAYQKLVKDWTSLLRAAALDAGVWAAEGPRACRFVRLMGSRNRHLDVFNLAGGLKPVVDAMVHLDILVDDDRRYFFPSLPEQRRAHEGELPGLRIVITELDADQLELITTTTRKHADQEE
jgi:hypothetical protein